MLLSKGQSIGHKRIVLLSNDMSTAAGAARRGAEGGAMTGLVAARVEASSPYDGIYLKDFAAFSDAGCALAPTPPPASPCSLVHDYL